MILDHIMVGTCMHACSMADLHNTAVLDRGLHSHISMLPNTRHTQFVNEACDKRMRLLSTAPCFRWCHRPCVATKAVRNAHLATRYIVHSILSTHDVRPVLQASMGTGSSTGDKNNGYLGTSLAAKQVWVDAASCYSIHTVPVQGSCTSLLTAPSASP